MMKKTSFLFLILITFVIYSIKSQNGLDLEGIYMHSEKWGYKSILDLKPDNTFVFSVHSNVSNYKVDGNWQVQDSIIILNSFRKEMITLKENFKKKQKGIKFNILDENSQLMVYHLSIVTENNDTIVYRDQFETTSIIDLKQKIIKFSIKDVSGLSTPFYQIDTNLYNFFNIRYTQIRIFNKEPWLIISKDEIKPMSIYAEYAKYNLIKSY